MLLAISSDKLTASFRLVVLNLIVTADSLFEILIFEITDTRFFFLRRISRLSFVIYPEIAGRSKTRAFE